MQPPAPQPQLREEDECPICHQALPPKGPDGSEVAREAHVQTCIETQFSTSGPRSSHPPPMAAPGAAIAASAATPSQAAGPQPIPTGHRTSTGSSDMPSASFQQRRRVAGMLVYHASEKDCVGEDGEQAQECVICFEEFSVGDEMGRLECLCKFHRVSQPSDKRADLWKTKLTTRCRRAYGNGGIRKVRELVQCIRKGLDLSRYLTKFLRALKPSTKECIGTT